MEQKVEENKSTEIRNIEEENIPPPKLIDVTDHTMCLKKEQGTRG
jgi:hypothetical protein